MITQCAVRTNTGISVVAAPGTVRDIQEACSEAGVDWHEVEPGFLTESGVFMTRKEAGIHAIACGQVTTIATHPWLSWSDLK